MSAIFISHSSKDNAFCQKLINWLDELGHRSVFLDFDENSGIAGGQDWEQKLYKELRVCSAMIVVCTEDLMNSKWCFAEITHARSLGKQIFPIQIAPCNINSILSNTQVIDFINLEEKVAFERLKQGIIKAGIDAKDPYSWDGSRPPYPGLLAFQEKDAAIFFGRSIEIREIIEALTKTFRVPDSPRLIMILGASGSGKSSLVRAGIIPRLKRDPERWLVLNPIQPGEDPFRELAKALKKAFENFAKEEYSIDELYGQLQSDLQLAKDSSKKLEPKNQFKNYGVFDKLHETADLANTNIILIIDQFEELLDRPKDHLGNLFLIYLKLLLNKKGTKLIVLATMRSDFLGVFQQNLALKDPKFEKILVGPIGTESLIEIIEKPAELAGVRIEPKLVQALIEDSRTDDALPLLAFTMRELYDHYSEDNLLEFREYEDLGGIHGSVAKSAEGVLSNPKLTTSQEELLRKAFLQMTRINEQGNFTRNRIAWNDINPETYEVLNRLVNGRLLVSSTDGNDIRTLEVAHESLFRSWKRLKAWLDEEREFLLWRNRLSNTLIEWENNNQDKSVLLSGVKLQEASSWLKSHQEQLNTPERLFIQESVKEDIRQKRIKQKRNAVLITIAISFLTSISILFINAEKEKTKAQANYLISEANRIVENDPTLALRLADEALNMQPHNLIIRKDAHSIYSRNSFYKAKMMHSESVNNAMFSPDGNMILTLSYDSTARLWDQEGNLIGKPMEHDGSISSILFSPDGGMVLTSSQDSTVRMWDLNGNPIGAPIRHSELVHSAIFSPNGNIIATTSEDGIARLWDLKGNPIGIPMEQTDHISFSPDGKMILTLSTEGSARIWDQKGNPIVNPFKFSISVYTACFSPDGKKILTASQLGTAQLWDLKGNPIGNPMEHISGITSAIFSPDGKTILTASEDETARRWDLQGNQIVEPLEHSGYVSSAVFSPNGKLILTASHDGSAQLWDLSGNKLGMPMLHSSYINSAIFSPDGKYILTASADQSARLWDLNGNSLGKSFPYPNHAFSSVFSPEGDKLLFLSSENNVSIWDLDGKPIGNSMDFYDFISLAIFSPDGKTILIASDDGNIQLWDTSGNLLEKAINDSGTIRNAIFSPDGKNILTISENRITKLWHISGNLKSKRLGQSQKINSAVFSSNGKTILTASNDSITQFWDLQANPVGKPFNHNESMSSASVSNDGKFLLTLSLFGTMKLWSLNNNIPGDVIKQLNGVNSAVFSPDGSMFLTSSSDGKACVWDLKGNPLGNPVVYTDHEWPSNNSAIFSPDGKVFMTFSGYDLTPRVWDLNGNLPLKPITNTQLMHSIEFSADGKKIVTTSEDGVVLLYDIIFIDDFLKSDHLAPLTKEQKEKYGIEEESWVSKLINKIFSD